MQSEPTIGSSPDRPTIPLSLLLAVHFHFPFMRSARFPFDVCREEVEAGGGSAARLFRFLPLSLSVPRGPPWEVGKRARMQQAPPTSLKERLLPSDLFLPPHHHSFPHRSGWEATVCNISSFLLLSLPSPTRSFSRLSPCGLGTQVTERLGVLGEDVDFFVVK